ncbi:M48 family metalloprotease [Streptosporangium sp. NPDC020072]|uniref:M48 family metalloprotease n=1 Tax=Streptosporangium sp. NPDC020072 TaxID=3154788 RepID=UPI00342FA5BB
MTTTLPLAVTAERTVSELAGLADLAAALRSHATRPGLLITLAPDLDRNAEASVSLCDGTARIDVGPALLTSDPQALYGVLAHEIAHHALNHGDGIVRRYRARVAQAALLGGLALSLPSLAVLALALLVIGVHLADARRSRLEEYDADAHGVRLLEATGLPGRQIMAAALADLPAESTGYRLAGWVFGQHPTARARRRTLAAGRPARRLRWALIWQRTTTPAAACYGLAVTRPDITRPVPAPEVHP